jgi:hypothetical protein
MMVRSLALIAHSVLSLSVGLFNMRQYIKTIMNVTSTFHFNRKGPFNTIMDKQYLLRLEMQLEMNHTKVN